jgi:hypothetical protein
MAAVERELVSAVDLCTPSGRLNQRAVGFSRQPFVTANLRGRGRAKRWDYWGIQSADAFIGITISDLDYATLLAVHAFAPGSDIVVQEAVLPLKQLDLSQTCDFTTVEAHTKDMSLRITPVAHTEADVQATLDISVRTKQVQADITVRRPAGRDCLAVVVPWSPTRFQYTVKDVGLPARGRLNVEGGLVDLPAGGTAATRDFGRGKWPYRISWNWGVGSAPSGDGDIALQVGGKWTDGTGSTENGVFVEGWLHKISSELQWQYDVADWMRPWRVRDTAGVAADLTFHPERVRAAKTEFGVIGSRAHQAFGTWTGWVAAGAERVAVDGLRGWAEELRNRW